jgi:large subunit ribosomal protein L29
MKASELRGRETAELSTLRDTMKKDLFSYRMKNLTNQLDDTSLLRKTQKDIARIESILSQREKTVAGVAEKGSEP